MPKRAANPKSKTAKAGGAAKPATRTAIQGAIGATVFIQGWNLFAPHPLTSEQTAWATVAITAAISFVMNLLEENGMPALLKGQGDDLTRRELNALAEAIGGLHDDVAALKGERPSMSGFNVPGTTASASISALQDRPVVWPPGGLG